MKVLGIDTSTSGCSAAVWTDGGIVADRRLTMNRGQAEALLPLIMETLEAAGIAEVSALDRIAVTIGPGAFTGLRIALATARGFAVATGCPLIGVTTFDAIAHALSAKETAGRQVLIAVDSRRTEPYLQLFNDALTPLGDGVALTPDAVAGWLPPGPLLVAGDGAAALHAALRDRPDTFLSATVGTPDAATVATLGAARTAGPPVRPLYLRPADVTMAKPKTRVAP